MTVLAFTCIMFLMSVLAGMIGALTGLGGGMIVIPVLVLFLQIDIHYALGAGLFAVMATSAGTAIAYLRSGFINIRIGMFLELAAALGALLGAYITALLPAHWVQAVFGVMFILLSYLNWRGHENHPDPVVSDPLVDKLRLNGEYPTPLGNKKYLVQRVRSGFCLMGVAGLFSGLLGIGSGTIKVVAMDQLMRLPYKVSTSTSNFIIGITAAVGAGVFLKHGYVDPLVTFPVVVGIVIGAFAGARLMPLLPVKPLRILFSVVILLLAVQMLYNSIHGGLF